MTADCKAEVLLKFQLGIN